MSSHVCRALSFPPSMCFRSYLLIVFPLFTPALQSVVRGVLRRAMPNLTVGRIENLSTRTEAHPFENEAQECSGFPVVGTIKGELVLMVLAVLPQDGMSTRHGIGCGLWPVNGP